MRGDLCCHLAESEPHHTPFSCCGQIPGPLPIHQQRLGIGQLRFRRNPSKPPGFQFVLWDTNARINGLVAVDARVTSAL